MVSHTDFRLNVTAGTSYDASTHQRVPVNGGAPLHFSGPGGDVWLSVHIKHHRRTQDPPESAYFDEPVHAANKDTYALTLWFVPAADIAGGDLQWGNDFDEPIRDSLPPGFSLALHIVKRWIDPGLDGQVYLDKPYLYGPVLSSMNRVHVRVPDTDGGADSDEADDADEAPTRDFGLWFDEGGNDAGRAWRRAIGCPTHDEPDATERSDTAASERKAWALKAGAADAWTFQKGVGYGLDFYNGYLDFETLGLKLPGFEVSLLRFWDGRQSLRYVLRNKATGAVYLAVVFALEAVGGDGDTLDDKDDKDQAGGPDISADDVD